MFDSKIYDKETFNKRISEYDDIEITYVETRLNEFTVSLTNGYDAVIAFVNDEINEKVIENLALFGIKAIFLRCAGYNNVDIKYCFEKGIKIYRVPAYSPHAVAEYTFALLQTLNRRTHKAYIRTRDFNFSLEGLMGVDLFNKTIGVIGTGKIGKEVIKIAKGYSMNILAFDLYKDDSLDVHYVDLDTLLKQSDFITLHIPLNENTKYIINERNINKMKNGVYIINTSRGGLIDTNALLDAIKSRLIGAAALDVYEEESEYFYKDTSNHIMNDETLSRLISMPNVIVSSHQAYLTKEALDNIASTTLDNIYMYFVGIPNTENEVCYKCDNEINFLNTKTRKQLRI